MKKSLVLITTALCAAAYAASVTVPSTDAPTIARAFIKVRSGDTVYVKDGVYRERVIVDPSVTLVAVNTGKATINGKGRKIVVTLGKGSSIHGFIVRNGTIGIASRSMGVSITQCRITGNFQTGIVCARHVPKIQDNIIAFNNGSGIQMWDARGGAASITHNTIAYNSNHGVSVGGVSNVKIEYNIIAFNERFGVKEGPKVDKCEIVNNDFFDNLSQAIPKNNMTYDPRFANPRTDFDFTVTSTESCSSCPENQVPGVRKGGG